MDYHFWTFSNNQEFIGSNNPEGYELLQNIIKYHHVEVYENNNRIIETPAHIVKIEYLTEFFDGDEGFPKDRIEIHKVVILEKH